jgi:hypothetical protein
VYQCSCQSGAALGSTGIGCASRISLQAIVENQTQWRGERDTGRRRLWTLLGLSVLLHVPLTPLAALIGLLGLLRATTDDVPEAPPLTAIPIDILEEGEDPGAGQPKPAATPAPDSELGTGEPEPRRPPPKPKPQPPELADAGADAGDSNLADAAAGDAGADDAGSGSGGIDPVALAGAAQRIADPNANVRMLIYTERIRGHALGGALGPLLGSVAQWRDFLAPGRIDPVRDIDRIYIAAPQLRDSSQMVAMLRYNTGAREIRAAIDALPGSEWLPGAPPAARARVDRAERVIAMATANHVWVVPPALGEQARKLRVSIPAAKGDEVMSGEIKTPWRAVIGLPFRIPQSILWLRFKVVPTPDGGAVIGIEARDASEEEASEHARTLEDVARGALQPNFGVFGMKFVESISFTSEGSKITGEITATAQQLKRGLGMIQGWVLSRAPAPRLDAGGVLPPSGRPAMPAPTPRRPTPPPPLDDEVPPAPSRDDEATPQPPGDDQAAP